MEPVSHAEQVFGCFVFVSQDESLVATVMRDLVVCAPLNISAEPLLPTLQTNEPYLAGFFALRLGAFVQVLLGLIQNERDNATTFGPDLQTGRSIDSEIAFKRLPCL